MTDNLCPTCTGPVEVWADNSDTVGGHGITVNFACDNAACLAGKGPWDTPRPRRFTVEMAHPECSKCEAAALDAQSLAKCVGSREVTVTDEQVGLTHSATVRWGQR